MIGQGMIIEISILNTLKTAEYLINNNFFVIRVGSLVDKSDLKNENSLDYPSQIIKVISWIYI